VEESLAEGTFGIHPFDDVTTFCIEKESLKHKMWVGGKDDWLVISNKRYVVVDSGTLYYAIRLQA
jgi:hypothetical protein